MLGTRVTLVGLRHPGFEPIWAALSAVLLLTFFCEVCKYSEHCICQGLVKGGCGRNAVLAFVLDFLADCLIS